MKQIWTNSKGEEGPLSTCYIKDRNLQRTLTFKRLTLKKRHEFSDKIVCFCDDCRSCGRTSFQQVRVRINFLEKHVEYAGSINHPMNNSGYVTQQLFQYEKLLG